MDIFLGFLPIYFDFQNIVIHNVECINTAKPVHVWLHQDEENVPVCINHFPRIYGKYFISDIMIRQYNVRKETKKDILPNNDLNG